MKFISGLWKSIYSVKWYNQYGMSYTFGRALWRYMRLSLLILCLAALLLLIPLSLLFTSESAHNWLQKGVNSISKAYPQGLEMELSAKDGVVTNATGPVVVPFHIFGMGRDQDSMRNRREMGNREMMPMDDSVVQDNPQNNPQDVSQDTPVAPDSPDAGMQNISGDGSTGDGDVATGNDGVDAIAPDSTGRIDDSGAQVFDRYDERMPRDLPAKISKRNHQPMNLLVIDTQADATKINEYDTVALLTKNALVVKNGIETTSYSIPELLQNTKDPVVITGGVVSEKMTGALNTVVNNKGALIGTYLIVALIFIVIFSFFAGLATAIMLLLYALLIRLLSYAMKKNYTYWQSYSYAAAGFVLPFLFASSSWWFKAGLLVLIVGRIWYLQDKRSSTSKKSESQDQVIDADDK